MPNFSPLRLIPAAKADLQGIWRYTVETWGEQQAEQYVDVMQRACHALTHQPLLGKAVPQIHKELRVYRCQRHLIFYLPDLQGVIFIAFLHERMNIVEQLAARFE